MWEGQCFVTGDLTPEVSPGGLGKRSITACGVEGGGAGRVGRPRRPHSLTLPRCTLPSPHTSSARSGTRASAATACRPTPSLLPSPCLETRRFSTTSACSRIPPTPRRASAATSRRVPWGGRGCCAVRLPRRGPFGWVGAGCGPPPPVRAVLSQPRALHRPGFSAGPGPALDAPLPHGAAGRHVSRLHASFPDPHHRRRPWACA